jgi:hypothetical protein
MKMLRDFNAKLQMEDIFIYLWPWKALMMGGGSDIDRA